MFKLIMIIGMIVLFNILSRKINNIAKEEEITSRERDDRMDEVWDNLERLAKEKQSQTTGKPKTESKSSHVFPAKPQGASVFQNEEMVEDLFVSDDEDETFVDDFGVKMAPKQMRKPLSSNQAKFSSVSQKSASAFEKSPSDGDLPSQYANHLEKLNTYMDKIEDNPTVSDISVSVSEIEKHDIAREDVTKSSGLSFSADPLVNGIIFSEILGKPKAKR